MKNTTMLSCQQCFYSTPTKVIVPLSALALVVTGVTLLILKHSPTLSGCLLGGGVCMSALLIPLFRPGSAGSLNSKQTTSSPVPKKGSHPSTPTKKESPESNSTWTSPTKPEKESLLQTFDDFRKLEVSEALDIYKAIRQQWTNLRPLHYDPDPTKGKCISFAALGALIGLKNEDLSEILKNYDLDTYESLNPGNRKAWNFSVSMLDDFLISEALLNIFNKDAKKAIELWISHPEK